MTEKDLEARAKRGSRRKFERVLSKVPDVEPEAFDRIPATIRRPARRAVRKKAN